MAIVTINQGESIESALRRFKRKVMTEEIIKDAKKHAFFIPPGQKAKLKSALARKRNKKKGRMRPQPRETSRARERVSPPRVCTSPVLQSQRNRRDAIAISGDGRERAECKVPEGAGFR